MRSASCEFGKTCAGRKRELATPLLETHLGDLLFGHAEVMSNLMDNRGEHLVKNVVFRALKALVRPLKDDDGIGNIAITIPVIVSTLGQGNAIVDSQQIAVLGLGPPLCIGKLFGRWLVTHQNNDVFHRVNQILRDGIKRILNC